MWVMLYCLCICVCAQGFVDAHTHVIPGGLALMRVQLRAVRSRAEWEARVSAAAAALGPGEWVLGGLWDESDWGGQLPSREWLDNVSGRESR